MSAEFLLFGELHPELRIKIWVLGFEPRTITWLNAPRNEFTNPSGHHGSETPELSGSIPSQLHVNYESRDVCKEYYQSLLSHPFSHFNPNIDTLYVPDIHLSDLLNLPNLPGADHLAAEMILSPVVHVAGTLPKTITLVPRSQRLQFSRLFRGLDSYPEFDFMSQGFVRGGEMAVHRDFQDRLVAAGIPRDRVPQLWLLN